MGIGVGAIAENIFSLETLFISGSIAATLAILTIMLLILIFACFTI